MTPPTSPAHPGPAHPDPAHPDPARAAPSDSDPHQAPLPAIWDMTLPAPKDPATLLRWHQAGVSHVSVTICSNTTTLSQALSEVGRYSAFIRSHAGQVRIAKRLNDIEANTRAGRMSVTFNLQDTALIADDLDLLIALSELGVRHALLTYNCQNFAGGGCADPSDSGLTALGRDIVARLNEVGVIVDGTHCGYRSSLEAIETSADPTIFSHSNAAAVFPHYRNITDEQIVACAAGGGVIGVNGVSSFLCDDPRLSLPNAMFRHVDHLCELVGAEHVGLGLDYLAPEAGDRFSDYVQTHPRVWPDQHPAGGAAPCRTNFLGPWQLPSLVQLMADHGYDEQTVAGILSGNFRRVAQRIWSDGEEPT